MRGRLPSVAQIGLVGIDDAVEDQVPVVERVQRSGEDLRPQLVARIARAVEASGLDREAYAVLVRSRDEETNAVLDEALAELAREAAKREALLRAFEASGRGSEHEFAEMYGMDADEVAHTLARARAERPQVPPAA